jgi:hypothetical protein
MAPIFWSPVPSRCCSNQPMQAEHTVEEGRHDGSSPDYMLTTRCRHLTFRVFTIS